MFIYNRLIVYVQLFSLSQPANRLMRIWGCAPFYMGREHSLRVIDPLSLSHPDFAKRGAGLATDTHGRAQTGMGIHCSGVEDAGRGIVTLLIGELD